MQHWRGLGRLCHTNRSSQLETLHLAQAKGNQTIITAKQGLGWKSGKPQQQIGVAIKAEQGVVFKEQLTQSDTGARKSVAKTIMWQIIICATYIVLNLVHKKVLYICYSIYHY